MHRTQTAEKYCIIFCDVFVVNCAVQILNESLVFGVDKIGRRLLSSHVFNCQQQIQQNTYAFVNENNCCQHKTHENH